MNTGTTIMTIGLLTALIGGLGIVGVLPLGALTSSNLVTFAGNPIATCTGGNCTFTIQAENGGEGTSYTVYFKITNSIGQTVSLTTQQVPANPPNAYLTQLVSGLSSGSYTISCFATDLSGNGISPTFSSQFSTGRFSLTMNPVTSGTTVPAAGTTLVPAGSQQVLSFTPGTGLVFQNWFITCDDNPNNVQQPTANPFSLNMTGNCVVDVVETITGVGQYVIVTPLIFGALKNPQGTLNPATPQTIYQSSTAGQTSVTFTETPTSGYSFTGWAVYGTSITGTASSITITYAQLAATQGATNFQLVATFSTQPTLAITTNTGSGITTTPALGNYQYPLGQSVTISEVTPATSCFLGWLVQQGSGNVQNMGTASSITITIQAGSNSVMASGAALSSLDCKSGTLGVGSPLSIGLFIAGIAMTSYGAYKKGKHE